MTFADAVRTVFNKYIVVSGRAPRAEYWFFILFAFAGSIVLGLLDGMLFGFSASISPLSSIFSLAIVIPSITVGVRRLHDRDMSGWWMLLLIVPLIGYFVLLILFALEGTRGANRFGPEPYSDDDSTPGGGVTTPESSLSQSSIPKVGRE